MESIRPIAVTVLGGYLGSGKTTLLNRMLQVASEQVAVIVNDFGTINVDASLIESRDARTISLTNGCVCCSLTDGLVDALATVAALRPQPSRLLIETSGVADPATVAAYGDTPGFVLDAVIVLVDAEQVLDQVGHHLVGDLVTRQLQAADLLVVNKSDLVEGDERDALEDWLANHLPTVPRLWTTRAAVPDRVLFDDHRGSENTTAAPGAIAAAEAGFKTWTNRADKPLRRDAIGQLVDSFPPGVVRGKGVVWLDDDPDTCWIFQLVGHRFTLEASGSWSAPPRTELVFIATTN